MQQVIYGLDELIQSHKKDGSRFASIHGDIAREIATTIQKKAVKNASGPNNPKWKASKKKKNKGVLNTKGTSLKKKKSKKKPKNILKELNEQPYPVSLNTGKFFEAHEVEEKGEGFWRVYGNQETANYFAYVHDGTWKMKERPTIDNAYYDVFDGENNEADKIIDEIIDEVLEDD